MITAPYNFVPLNKEVFYPEWAKDVSHDIPFEDAISGTINLKLEAHSPIFVRDSEKDELFCNHNGIEYIPGSSVKGAMRTVFDVFSYGKLKLQDKRLSYRDLNHNSYKKKAMDGNKIHMGWLTKKANIWQIDDLGKTNSAGCRIKYFEMKEYLDKNIVQKIRNKKQAYEKYKVVNDRKKLETNDGTIVFTGTAGKKTKEFFFPKKVKRTLVLGEEVVQTFYQAYYIGTVEENLNWKNLWSAELKKGEKIPVFFQVKDEKVVHFGLSMLYKLPYEKTIMETLLSSQNYKGNSPDLGETLFGYVHGDNSLKGRVQFSHFTIKKKVEARKKATLPLSSPRSTFFPAYLEQKMSADSKTKKYITYDDNEAVLRGFKFYPPQQDAKYSDGICKEHPKVCTTFYPLDKGSVFEGKVRFFNLKKCELGALIATLTLLDRKDTYHKIGMAKPFGFGTVKSSIIEIQDSENNFLESKDFVDDFTKVMKQQINVDIMNDARIESLFMLSSYVIPDKSLVYMPIKSFVNAKKPFNKFCLPMLTKFSQKIVDNKSKNSVPKQTINTRIYTMKEIAELTSSTVQEVITFSIGLHFGELRPDKTLKEQQAKDLINRMIKGKQVTIQPKSKTVAPATLSKTKLRKAVSEYWRKEFGVMYHRNQIKEFILGKGFDTTPEEQRTLYLERENDKSFNVLCKLIHMLEFGEMDNETKEKLYLMLMQG